MASPDYTKAHKQALKAYRQDIRLGRHPYLPILDELLSFTPTAGERDLGLIDIPLDRVIGTKTAGRTRAFSSNFMPLLAEGTEFCDKWSTLIQAQTEEGIRDPIIVSEFMNNYYVIEGNKRVSVLKYVGAVSVDAYVTRILPVPSEAEEIRTYYEFVDFQNASGINTIYFSRPGRFHTLCELVGKSFGEPWTTDEKRLFSSRLLRFTGIYREKGGDKLPITVGDAFLLYLNVYSYQDLEDKSTAQIREDLVKLWDSLTHPTAEETQQLEMQPEEEKGPSVIKKLFPAPKLRIGFLYFRDVTRSGWTASHNLGRLYLEEQMNGRVETRVYDGIETDEESAVLIEKAIEEGCQVIFTTSPRFLNSSIKASLRHPEVKILNCSLNTNSGTVRTYYGRLYEAKFLVGMLAGILTDTANIGYIADFPIAGIPASINAFALGVKMVNPKATVHLAWATAKEGGIDQKLREANVSHISGRDTMAPLYSEHPYGLYNLKEGGTVRLAAAIWHWGKFYHRIVQSILNGNWTRKVRNSTGNTLNYWWGISSGMIDFIYSASIPPRTIALVKLVRNQIMSGNFQIFSGDLYDQELKLRNENQRALTPLEIIRMDWLLDNIKGSIPAPEELSEEAAAVAAIQSIRQPEESSLL